MSKITLSDGPSILKIHGIAQALMTHHYAHMQSLVQDLGPLLHERPALVGDCYQILDSCLRDNVGTHQELGMALQAYEADVLLQKDDPGVIPGLKQPLRAYQALIQDHIKAYALLKLQHLSIEYALSMMCLNYGFEEGSAGAFCIQQLRESFKVPKAFIREMVFILKALEAVLSRMLDSDQDRCVSGMELFAEVAVYCQSLSLETAPFLPTPYGGTAIRLERLKKAQIAHRDRAGMDDTDKDLEDGPVF